MFCLEYSRVSFLVVPNANLPPLAYFLSKSLVSSLVVCFQIFSTQKNFELRLEKAQSEAGDVGFFSCPGGWKTAENTELRLPTDTLVQKRKALFSCNIIS